MIQFLSEIAWYQLLLLLITQQTAVELFRFQMAVTAGEQMVF